MTDDLRAQLQASLGTAYTLERELGGGGMSRVFVVRDTALGRDVVVKTLSPELTAGLSLDRFAREVKLAARLQQANIVPVLSAGDADGVPYFTMPFVDGLSLRARLQQGMMPVGEAVHVLRDVAKALAFAHAQGVVHRDIKPENVLLSGGTAMVADFGIAKALVTALSTSRTPGTDDAAAPVTLESLTQLGSALGTPAYMAPEQAAADPTTDHRADLYAWGVMAYEMLAGKHPFSARITPRALLAAHMAEAPAPLAGVRDGVPEAIAALVMRCLEKDPARRPATATELLQSLDQATTPGASSASGATPTTRNNGTRRRVVAIVAGAAVLVAAGVAGLLRRTPSAGNTAQEKSLAVLPFTSTGGDTANAYFAEGIADEVTTRLSQVPGLRLAGRRSAARFAGKGATAQDIGAALQVGAVLEGTVRRVGDQLRVSVELSDAHDGRVVWQQSYERAARDVYAVQDEIARAIAVQLQVTLADAATGSAARGTADLAAYDLYLKGMYLYRRRAGGLTEARALLEQAVARDSTFAKAWAGLARALVISAYFSDTHMRDVLPAARAAAERAVRLEPELPDAHLALGLVHAESFEWAAAEAAFRRAIALDPNGGESWYRLGLLFSNMGRIGDAIAPFKQSKARDPLDFVNAAYLGSALAFEGQSDAGIAELRRSLELEPGNLTALGMLANVHARFGPADSAKAVARRLIATSTTPGRLGTAAFALALVGERREALEIARRLEALPADSWTRSSGLTSVYFGLGDTTRAMEWLERAARGDGDLLLGYSSFRRMMPVNARTAAVMQRYHLDVATYVQPAASPRP